MKRLLDEEALRNIQNFSKFYFMPFIRTNKPNNRNQTKRFMYIRAKKEDCFSVTLTMFLDLKFANLMRFEQEYVVRAYNKYNGQIIGLIASITKRSDGALKIDLDRNLIKKPVNRLPSNPYGGKRLQGKRKPSYIKYAILKRQAMRQCGYL